MLLLLIACASNLPTGDATNGAVVFDSTCASCHGADGTGGSGPDLTTVTAGFTDQELTDIILGGTGSMPAQNLTDQEAADAVAFMVDSWG